MANIGAVCPDSYVVTENRSTSFSGFRKCNTCCHSYGTKGTEILFLKAITVWINKPHVVNRRLCGSKIVELHRCDKFGQEDIEKLLTDHRYEAGSSHHIDQPFTDLSEESSEFTVMVRELIPKSQYFSSLLEIIVYDKSAGSVSFIPCRPGKHGPGDKVKTTEEIAYCIQLDVGDKNVLPETEENEMQLSWSCDHIEEDSPKRQMTSKWLRSVLLGKLLNWSLVSDISTCITSLRLVPVDRYKDMYVRLKNTYGRDLVKNWTERTDPKKYVYEDIAIAAYLLLIWEDECKKKNLSGKQNFVDLGCGNGLLVYILTQEGHKGLGIDLKKRKIWDTFGLNTDLRETTITPSADHLFPHHDWIIGNHSDELTPWIPVIAARSSYSCNFFLLPCCHHDFVGKYGTTQKGKSLYASYLSYMETVVKECGFLPECDSLRIPSTKRICYIGRERTYEKETDSEMDKHRQEFIDERTSQIAHLTNKKKRNQMQGESQSADQETTVEVSVEPCANLFVRPRTDLNIKPYADLSSLDSGLGSLDSCSSTPVDDRKPSFTSLGSLDSCLSTPVNDRDPSACLLEPERKLAEEPSTRKAMDDDTTDCVRKKGRLRLDGKDMCTACLDERGSGPVSHCVHLGQEVHLTGKVQDSVGGKPGEIDAMSTNATAAGLNISRPHYQHSQAQDSSLGKGPLWGSDFRPRPAQVNKNCQSVPESVKRKIVEAVFKLVLTADGGSVSEHGQRSWHTGGAVPLSEAVSLLDKSILLQLKSECGGLQTLLRNHSHIFQVTSGKIKLRDFTKLNPWEGRNPHKVKGKQLSTLKTTLCWFNDHHPDGCPRMTIECLFAHGREDMREKC